MKTIHFHVPKSLIIKAFLPIKQNNMEYPNHIVVSNHFLPIILMALQGMHFKASANEQINLVIGSLLPIFFKEVIRSTLFL